MGRSDTPKPVPHRARRWIWGTVAFLLLLTAGVLTVDALVPPNLSRLAPTWTVTDRHGQVLRAFLSPDDTWRLPTTPADVDPLYLRMLLAYEDRRFSWHPGVDPLAVLRAMGQAITSGRIISGASTLTMQTARLLEPRPRTLPSKLIEMARALQLTAHLGRNGVLSAYLTLASFGGNLEGVRAATWAWWGKEPYRLTPGQAALLVVLPQNPNGLRPDRHPQAARDARAKVLARMVTAGVLTADQARDAKAEPLPATRRPLPMLAPHLTGRLVRQARLNAGPILQTTLDATLQARVEALVRAHAQRLEDARLSIAALVVDADTGAARAWVGSPDLLDVPRHGAVDMTQAPRSPGSALKPLIYGMAFEDGFLHPLTEIDDRPTRFGKGYTPDNFGFAHYGEVTATEALQQSLNVPAVAVLERVGPIRFAARLRTAGVEPRRQGGLGRPGLPLALGGLGVTLEEMVGLYASLSSGGERRTVRTTPRPAPSPSSPPATPPIQVLSPAAAWQVVNILVQAPPAAGFAPDAATRDPRTVAFKTGTSYGFRDAWALGMDGDHVVGVWVGRADGTPVPGRIGRDTAAPLMRRLFNLLPTPRHALPGPPPPGLLTALRTIDLPPPLQRLRPVGATPVTATDPDGLPPLILSFPPDGATMDWGQAEHGLALEAHGGRRPYAWIVNGRPLTSAPWHRGAQWTPEGRGRVRVTVVDAEGRSETVNVWLQ